MEPLLPWRPGTTLRYARGERCLSAASETLEAYLAKGGAVNHTAGHTPIMCRLFESEFREREATLLARFKAAVASQEALVDGYLFRLPGDSQTLALITELMVAERQCCPFLTFELTAWPNLGSLELLIVGPDGSKDFLKALFQPTIE